MYGSTQRQLKDFISSLMPAGLFSKLFLNSTVHPIRYCLIKTVKVIKIKQIQSWIRLNLRHNLIAVLSTYGKGYTKYLRCTQQVTLLLITIFITYKARGYTKFLFF